MLFLKTEKARGTFHNIYKNSQKHFNKLHQMYTDVKRGGENYFIKKQSEMILRYLEELQQANQNLISMDEKDIVTLFEKQYKLKKIIQKLVTHL
jgi:hypothetical protein